MLSSITTSLSGGVLDILLAERQLLLVVLLHLLEVRLLVPSVVLGWAVNLLELLLRWVDLVGGLLRGITGDVAEQDSEVVDCKNLSVLVVTCNDESKLTKLAELAIGDDECAESAEALEGLVAVLLCGILFNWHTRLLDTVAADGLSLPDEVLEEVAVVLGEKHDLGLLDDIAQISDEVLAFRRELLRG